MMDYGKDKNYSELQSVSRFIQASLSLMVSMGAKSIDVSIANGCFDACAGGIDKANVWDLSLIAPVHLSSDSISNSSSEFCLRDVFKGGFRTYLAFGSELLAAFTANNFTQAVSKIRQPGIPPSTLVIGKLGIETELAISIFEQASWSLPIECRLNGDPVNTLASCKISRSIYQNKKPLILDANDLGISKNIRNTSSGEFLVINGVCIGSTHTYESPTVNFLFSNELFCGKAITLLNSSIDQFRYE